LAFLAGPTYGTWSGLGGFVEGSIQTKAGDHANWMFELAQLPKQLNHGKTAVRHDHQEPFGQPATSLQDHLECPACEFLMFASLALVVPF